MTPHQIFKATIEAELYNRHDFMCLSLSEAENASVITRLESQLAEKDIAVFMQALARGHRVSSCMTSSINQWMSHRLNEPATRPGFSERVSLAYQIYSDWDRRWDILHDDAMAREVKAKEMSVARKFKHICESGLFKRGTFFILAIDESVTLPQGVKDDMIAHVGRFNFMVHQGSKSLGSALAKRLGSVYHERDMDAEIAEVEFQVYNNWMQREAIVSAFLAKY